MRAFLAIELPHEIKLFLSRIQEQLKTSNADIRWVEPKNIHLTLKFLGEIDEAQFRKIEGILQDTLKDRKPFSIRLASLGAFPKIDFPRILWVGIGQGDMEIKDIAKALEERITKAGIPKEEKAFSSHITIGRMRSALNREALVQNIIALASRFKDASGLLNNEPSVPQPASSCGGLQFHVTKIAFFKSTLTPKGPIYEILKENNLRAA